MASVSVRVCLVRTAAGTLSKELHFHRPTASRPHQGFPTSLQALEGRQQPVSVKDWPRRRGGCKADSVFPSVVSCSTGQIHTSCLWDPRLQQERGLSRDPHGAPSEVREGRPSAGCPQACREHSDHGLVAGGLSGQLQKTRGPQNPGLAHSPQEACLDSPPGQSSSERLPSTRLVCPFPGQLHPFVSELWPSAGAHSELKALRP